MRPPLPLTVITPEEVAAYKAGFRRGRYERMGNWAWRMTILVLAITGFQTLLSNFGLFLLACMGIDTTVVENWGR